MYEISSHFCVDYSGFWSQITVIITNTIFLLVLFDIDCFSPDHFFKRFCFFCLCSTNLLFYNVYKYLPSFHCVWFYRLYHSCNYLVNKLDEEKYLFVIKSLQYNCLVAFTATSALLFDIRWYADDKRLRTPHCFRKSLVAFAKNSGIILKIFQLGHQKYDAKLYIVLLNQTHLYLILFFVVLSNL